MKRGISGVYQHVSKQHLQRYCAEFDHRFTYQTANGYSDLERTDLALEGISGKRLTYKGTKASERQRQATQSRWYIATYAEYAAEA